MGIMSKYCKAYSIKDLRRFSNWKERNENARKVKHKCMHNKEVEIPRTLADVDYLFIQENYAVTDGIFKDKNIIFDEVTTEWIDYCRDILGFKIPSNVSTPTKEPTDSKGLDLVQE